MENQHVINMLGITNQQVYNNRRDINNLMELWTSTRDQLSGGSGRTPVYNPMISNLDGGGFSITNIQDLVAKGSGTFGGTLTVSGATSLGGSLTVTGITNLNNNLNVTGTTTISNITPANGTGSGAHVVQGGASVTLDFYIGHDLNVIGNSILTGTLDVSGITTINNNTLSTNSTNGALLVIGGVGIGENLNVGGSASVTGTLIVSQATTLGSTLSVGSNATITGTLTVIGATTLGNLTVTTLNATSTAVATNTSTGSITTLGGIGIAKNVQIGQDLNVIGASSLAETTCSGHLKIITGTSGANVDVINQENGSIHFTNGDSTSPVPNIVGKSITNTGLVILTSTPDVPASGKDIQFNVVNNSNTSHIDTTQTAYSFNVANNEKLGIIRNGAISVSGSYGTSGQVLSSNGNTGPPTWVDPAAGGTEIVATNNLVAKLGTAGTNLTSGYENILLGLNAGNSLTTGYRNVFINSTAGNNITTGSNNICLGNNSGTQTNTSVNNLISIGPFAGGSGSGGNNSISIGGSAGYQHVAAGSINIGSEAGKHYASYTDGAGAINIGGGSGRNQSKANSVNIGSESGYSNNSVYAVNIGRRAGYARSGASSINLGSFSNETNITTHDRAIVINASGVNVPSVADDTFVVKPIRNATGSNALFYDSGSGEITYDTASSGGTELLATNNLVSKLDTATSLTTGTNNIILGDLAGKSISTQVDNVFIGHKAGNNAITDRGVAIGFEAGKNVMGQSVVCIGQKAGENNAGNYSVLIGFGAGQQGNNYANTIVLNANPSSLNPNGSNRCFMKPIRNATGSSALFYDSSSGEITYDTASSGGTEIVDTQNIRSLTNNTGTALTSGALNNIILGEDCGDSITTGDNNTIIGKNILRVGNPQSNILIGNGIGLQTTGSYNVCLGFNISNNISQGLFATDNVMIGRDVGGGRTVGINNVFIGKEVNKNNGGASIANSVMIGRQAGSDCPTSNNVFVGYGAGQVNFNGGNNTSVGVKAGTGNNSSSTVNIGSEAGRVRPTGHDHAICIGTQTGNYNSGAHSIQIGYRANYNTPAAYQRVIVINATGSALESAQSDTCKIAPIRPLAHHLGIGILAYDTTTSELSVSSTDITKFHAEFLTDPTDITTSGTIVFDSTIHNTNNGYNTGTGVFTAPTNGMYRFECFYQLSTNDAITLNWKVNSTINKIDEVYNAHGGSTYRSFTTSWAGVLGTNDTIELAVFATTGTIRFSKSAKNGLTGYYIGK